MQITAEIQGRDRVWRLQQDGGWRALDGGTAIRPGDRMFIDPRGVRPYYGTDLKVVLDGQEVIVNPDMWQWGEEMYHFAPRVHRLSPPPVPSRDEMVRVIQRGDDNVTQTLVLTLDGHFRFQGGEPGGVGQLLPADGERLLASGFVLPLDLKRR